MSLQAWLLLGLNIIMLLVGQVLIKWDLDRMGGFQWNNLLATVTSPGILGGVLALTAGLVVWFRVLSLAPFSVAYPAQSSSYLIGIILGWLFFGESIPTIRWVGGLVILLGAYLVSVE
ncbi:EamA family transporter [Heliobacterium undosum]|uniref:EamA family transporter n=1 Tax=Heliomicrobium undosum TaxID=121734 RepID=A0A845L1I8_9FIRM|nr:EamA family transporter [Heliomicrobium undosum]MZP28654.1 EamA family transporter [Heliomicrobium undosum]